MSARFKRPRLRDRKYLDSYEGTPCEVCGSEGTTVGAHMRTGHEGGVGLKPSDDLTVGLCFTHHAEQEDNPGPEWWLENILKPILRNRYQEWKNG